MTKTRKITGVIFENHINLTGNYPDVRISESVDYNKLTEGDDNPVFITLPIGQVDTKSRNGRHYNRENVETIVNAINEQRSIGQKGHLRDDERAYRFDIPPLFWLGATLETDGRAWAKGYVLQSAPDVREYVRVAKATNSKIGTSIYGTGDVDDEGNVSNLDIESIDLAHPGRLGVEMAGAVPIVTQETIVEDTEQAEETTMPSDAIKEQNGQNTPVDSPSVQEIAELKRQHRDEVRELQGQLDDNRDKLADFAAIAELLGNPKDVVVAARAWKAQIADLQRENKDLLKEAIKAQVAEAVAIEDRRPVIEQLVSDREPTTRNEVTSRLEEVLKLDYVKTLLKSGVQEQMGPKQQRPVKSSEGEGEAKPLIIIPGADK